MSNGSILAICICPVAGDPMHEVEKVEAIAGAGLQGDRYCYSKGSFNKGHRGKRQVTLINGAFFQESGFEYVDSRRNIVTLGVELMWLIGREFQLCDTVIMRGIKYCDPCNRPSKLRGEGKSFKDAFHDRGGLVAEILVGGSLWIGGHVIPPPKGY